MDNFQGKQCEGEQKKRVGHLTLGICKKSMRRLYKSNAIGELALHLQTAVI